MNIKFFKDCEERGKLPTARKPTEVEGAGHLYGPLMSGLVMLMPRLVPDSVDF